MIKKFLLYFNTIKYLKPVQIYGRISSKLKSKIPKNYFAPSNLITNLKFKTDFIQHDPWNDRTNLLNGDFCFLNKKLNLSFPPIWNSKADLLWKFNLHYFHYLFLLTDNEKDDIVIDWIENNPVGLGVGWQPYVISLRLINWIREDFTHPEIIKSIYLQADYLYRNLEFYHPANHYLENAKALIFAGCFIKNDKKAERWFNKGKDIYKKELLKQVLDDGSYFEITPMYHAKILEGLLDIINILDQQDEFANFLNDYIQRMLFHLAWITHPDGNIALINDSTHEIVASTERIIKYSEDLGFERKSSSVEIEISKYFNDSGLGILRNNEIYFIIKAGEIGPDEIPAHAHADIFTYELSFMGKQFIVDSGVYEYISSEMREYCRSTKAHNTVEIDGTNQCEVWGAHRVGRRYKPKNVKWEENNDLFLFYGEFDGYNFLIGDNLNYKRNIQLSKNESVFTFSDKVTGKGQYSVKSYIHFHPEVQIIKEDKNIILSRNKKKVELKINGDYIFDDGWYCPEFGKKIENKILCISIPLNKEISYSFKAFRN